mgnify:CR=1 FL=1
MERDGVLNMALAGNGMFVTTTPNSDGTPSEVLSFTRDGEFSLDENGVLRSSKNDISTDMTVLVAEVCSNWLCLFRTKTVPS